MTDTTLRRNYDEELLTLIRSEKNPEILKNKLSQYHENDIADVFTSLTEKERFKLYLTLDIEEISDIFSYLDDVQTYIAELDKNRAADIIEEMDADDAVDLLEELDEDKRKELIALMDKESVEDIRLIQKYDDDEIGSLMTTNFIVVKKSMTVKQTMRTVIAEAKENDNIMTIFVLNDDGSFYGTIELRDLIIAREATPLGDIIKTSYPVLYAKEKIAECVVDLKEYALDCIPVLSEDRKILGIVTGDDIIELIDSELGEDYAKLAGLTNEEELNEPITKSMRKRLPWLILLMGLDLLVSVVLSGFQAVIVALPSIVFFQSLVLDMSGNAGTQSLAVTIRLINDENELERKRIRKMALKEVRVGVLNGLVLGLTAFILVGIALCITKMVIETGVDFSPFIAFRASTAVGIALMAAITISTSMGAVVPIIFKKLKVDPAVASGPFITTVNDIIGVAVYYGIAALLFGILL